MSRVGFRFTVFAGLLAIAACNRPADYAIVGSAEVPSAHGDVEIEKIDKEQILVTVVLDALPPPDEIEPGLTHYVLWFVLIGEDPARQGTLEYDPDERVGRVSVPTSLREFELRVTAEATADPQIPSYLLVATQKIRED